MATRTKKIGDIDNRLEALRSDLDTLQSDVSGLAGDAGVVANERISMAIRSAEDVAKRALHLAEDATSEAIGTVEHWANGNLDAVRSSIRNQPLYAIGLSVGLGAVVGAVLSRR